MPLDWTTGALMRPAGCLPCCVVAVECCTSEFGPNGDDVSSLTITGASPTFHLAGTTSNSSPTLSLGFTVTACVVLSAGSVLTLSATNIDGTCEADGGTLNLGLSATDPDGNPLTPTSTTDTTAVFDIDVDGCYCCTMSLFCVGFSAGPVAATLDIDSDGTIGCDEIAPPP